MGNKTNQKSHTVAVVDDHHIVRNGLVAAINNFDAYEVVLEASHGKELLDRLVSDDLPEIIIIDLHMPVMDGFETLEQLRIDYPEIKSLALTVDATEDSLIRAIRSGARGFIRKNARPTLFKDAIDSLVLTGYFHNEDIHNTFVNNPALRTRAERKREDIIARITPRELEFLRLVCRKDEPTYDQIADAMGITRRTVDYYRQELFEKFEIKSKVGLVLFAVEHQLAEI